MQRAECATCRQTPAMMLWSWISRADTSARGEPWRSHRLSRTATCPYVTAAPVPSLSNDIKACLTAISLARSVCPLFALLLLRSETAKREQATRRSTFDDWSFPYPSLTRLRRKVRQMSSNLATTLVNIELFVVRGVHFRIESHIIH